MTDTPKMRMNGTNDAADLDNDSTETSPELVTPLDSFSASASSALSSAADVAASRSRSAITCDDLFVAILGDPESAASRLLQSLDFSATNLVRQIQFILGESRQPAGSLPAEWSPRLTECIEVAGLEAAKWHAPEVQTTHLLVGILRDRRGLASLVLETPGIGLEPVGAALSRAMRDQVTDQR